MHIKNVSEAYVTTLKRIPWRDFLLLPTSTQMPVLKLVIVVCISSLCSTFTLAQEPVIGGPCQGCELVFVGMPAELTNHARISPAQEKGEALRLNGIVFKPGGSVAAGIIVYAYQTDNQGIYPKGATRHGKLRGWAMTNEKGEYSFETIRPMAYPGRSIPQHIHLHIIEPNLGTYYIDDVTFDDDPLLTAEHRKTDCCRGGCGISYPKRDEMGVWFVQRNIVLGQDIPNYRWLK